MKHLVILLSILALNGCAQPNLVFDKRFVECEDKWVAFSKDEDDTYTYGFIYIDAQAGLTFNKEGSFKYNKLNAIEVEKITGSSIKARLKPNNVKVAIIPSTMFKDLQIEEYPDWLKFYKTDTGTVKRLYSWGYMYNGWGECKKALSFLEKAKTLEPEYKGLNVELAYSYNCLSRYDKAEKVLELDVIKYPQDAYINKEYIYTLSKNHQIDLACQHFSKTKTILKDKQYHAENCYNIMQYYYDNKDKINFIKWYKELENWEITNELIRTYADSMKKNLEK